MASENVPLLDFIDAAKKQGATDEFIVSLLRENGWSEKRIYQAFKVWYEARLGVTVPYGGGRREAAKDAFLYLLAFIALAIWATQLGALFFTAIDQTFPNPSLDFTSWSRVTIQLANELASVIVAFPLFLLITRLIVRSLQQQPERLESGVRKWLTYIALVVTVSTIIADVVTFLAYFLRGDLSERFVLKVVTVLVIAGGVFAYYLDSLRGQTAKSNRNRFFAVGALAVVAFGIIVGFVQIGSPAYQRTALEDSRRLFDLSSLAEGVHSRWLAWGHNQFVLPSNTQQIQWAGSRGAARIVDPVNGRLYEYFPLQGTNYRLCATFSRPSAADVPVQWRHSAGHVCFSRDAGDNVQMTQQAW